MTSQTQHMHDNPVTALGNGEADGAGDKFYVLGKRCETNEPDNDSTTKDNGDHKFLRTLFMSMTIFVNLYIIIRKSYTANLFKKLLVIWECTNQL